MARGRVAIRSQLARKSGDFVPVFGGALASRCEWCGGLRGDAGRGRPAERLAGVCKEGRRPRRRWRRGEERDAFCASGSQGEMEPPAARPGGTRADRTQRGMDRCPLRNPGCRSHREAHVVAPHHELSFHPHVVHISFTELPFSLVSSLPGVRSRTRLKRAPRGRKNVSRHMGCFSER
jgi:hypothetical protein